MQGQLRVSDGNNNCWNWLSDLLGNPPKNCIFNGSVLKVGEGSEAKYYCFNTTPFQIKMYKTSFKYCAGYSGFIWRDGPTFKSTLNAATPSSWRYGNSRSAKP